ncbi:MAG: hypothetical protein WC606_03090 [Candidatus Absconditabacterales bacterium]
MISTRKQLMRMIVVTIVACLCFSYTMVSAATPMDTVINTLYNQIDSNPGQLVTLIRDYCAAVLNSSAFTQDSFVYNAQQSAFVHLLCSNLGQSSPYFTKEDYFKRASFKQLGFTDIVTDEGYSVDLCSSASFSNDCDLSKNIPKLFNSIMNDYINIKQSGLYGSIVSYKSEADLEKDVVNPYSKAYFGIDLCDNTDHPYPKTCRMMKSYVKSVRNILSEVQIFNTDTLLTLVPNTDDPSCSSVNNTQINLFYCGLKDGGASMISFVNLLYNELFYYRLFEGYYMIMLQKYPSLTTTSYSTIFKKFSSEYIWSKTALSLSLRMMRDTYMAFPFHVGFSMYQEDLDGFGKNLAKIAPSIYTLYDKLRNVQSQ